MLPKFEYPVARRDESIVDDFHGTKVKQQKYLLVYFWNDIFVGFKSNR